MPILDAGRSIYARPNVQGMQDPFQTMNASLDIHDPRPTCHLRPQGPVLPHGWPTGRRRGNRGYLAYEGGPPASIGTPTWWYLPPLKFLDIQSSPFDLPHKLEIGIHSHFRLPCLVSELCFGRDVADFIS